MSLFKQIEEMIEIVDEIKLNNGEMAMETDLKIAELQRQMSTKIDDCYKYIIVSEAMVENYKACAQPYLDAAKNLKNKVDRFKSDYLPNCLNLSGEDSINGELWQLKFRRPSKVVYITSDESIPETYTSEITTVKIDKKALLKDLKAGETINGAEMRDGEKKAYFGRAK